MSETSYTFNISEDFPNGIVDLPRLTEEIRESAITIALSHIGTEGDSCNIYFKDVLPSDSSALLITLISEHQGEPLTEETPQTPDGVPIVRADSRPLITETYFTTCGDDSTSIGNGTSILWDFSNDDNLYEGDDVPSGFKAKKFTLTFHCPVYLKDGSIYFFNAPWGCYVGMYVGVPANSYYPNEAGSIPASALGLNTGLMYAYTTEDIVYQRYVNKHRMYGDCPMGDELNTEGAAINPIPPGWHLCGIVYTPESDTSSKGYASVKLYRCHTHLLPGQTVDNLH